MLSVVCVCVCVCVCRVFTTDVVKTRLMLGKDAEGVAYNGAMDTIKVLHTYTHTHIHARTHTHIHTH